MHELESLENGYRLFILEGYKKNFVNLELKYVGQAKVSIEKKSEFEVSTMKEGPRFDGETLYAIDGYGYSLIWIGLANLGLLLTGLALNGMKK